MDHTAAVYSPLPDSAMDFDYINDLMLDGCWLETTDGSEFLQLSPSSSAAFFDPPYIWPSLENSFADITTFPSQKTITQQLPANLPSNDKSLLTQPDTTDVNAQYGIYMTQSPDFNKRWRIGPRADQGLATSVMQRLIWALDCIKNSMKDKHVLVQLWVPVKQGGKLVLTTDDQPFSLQSNCQRLTHYRNISIRYHFSAEGDSKDMVGLPGRVFLGKIPEWSPDVQLFRRDEYLRVNDAQRYDVRGTLALPVFEQGSRSCLGVIEVVTTTQKIKYRSEIENVCKALAAVDLRSSEVPSIKSINVSDKSYQVALPEILQVLKCACETHRLPLAQTWVPCIQQDKQGPRHSDETYPRCVSTVDSACYIADPSIQPFHEACSEHHLLKGQGVAGSAFVTNQPCFSSDITSYTMSEYPLAHHAMMFGLCAAVAIRFRSIHAGTADFVLELFLPRDCKDPEEQKKLLNSLSIIIQQVCRTLRVVTDKELEDESGSTASEAIVPNGENSSPPLFQQSGNIVSSAKKENLTVMVGEEIMECGGYQEEFSLKGSGEYGVDSTFGEASFTSVNVGGKGEKRRSKAEKNITLQVLQQYFAGSLKDAAKSIGVCPTTLKRICRQHGIKRWPSRKIKKVGHSLQKLQLVIDSVQGASGSLQIGSFYTNFPELASPKVSVSGPFSSSKQSNHSKPSPEGSNLSPQVTAPKSPTSSCSQSSNSSHCYSSGAQRQPSLFNVSSNEDVLGGESSGDDTVLKRVKSGAQFHSSSLEGENLIRRSQSHIILKEQSNMENLIKPSPENSGQVSEEGSLHRVKVAYGNEIIRLRMPRQWRFNDLWQEIAGRFQIDDRSKFDIKYMDDDSEWVLMTCDADLDECVDVCQSQTIKLLLQVSHHHQLARSW
ncbi:hypothetical protein ACFE04_025613 [Oxalis oulophora]